MILRAVWRWFYRTWEILMSEHRNYGGIEADVVHLGISINLGKLEEMQTIWGMSRPMLWEMGGNRWILSQEFGCFVTWDT